MPNRAPADRNVLISVDPYTRVFHYTFQGGDNDGGDASNIVLINGDRLVWVLDLSISPRTFQIDFGLINPFQMFKLISLRGIDAVVSPVVNFSAGYSKNRLLKYSVALGNGWTDDPDVVPSPTDPGSSAFLIQVQADGTYPDGLLAWLDATETNIVVSPAAMTANAHGGKAQVTWNWASDQVDTSPFTLAFTNKTNPNWPDSIDSGDIPGIVLSLAAGTANFKITATNKDGNLESNAAPATLTIT